MPELNTDVLIVGGGPGGIAAALSVLEAGYSVVLSEETEWLGGQLTAQAVPPDEHPWIEEAGRTESYARFRERIREYYRRNYPLTQAAASEPHLNPGMGNVSPLCHEPRVAVAVINELLAPFIATGRVTILMRHQPTSVDMDGDRVAAVTLRSLDDGTDTTVVGQYVLDASELGDLLPLANVEHVIGSESQEETGEPHALAGAAGPLDQQSISWCFAISYHPGEDHTITRPDQYDFWREYRPSYWPGPQLSWTTSNPVTLEPETRPLFQGPSDARAADDLWHFRRIIYRRNFQEGHFSSDVVVVNWPQLDYTLGPIIGVDAEERRKHLVGARQLALSIMYWMQTEAPRHDGGEGYPGLRLRGDVLGTSDGLAKYPYVRESRRIKAEFTVTENHVGVAARGDLRGAENFHDSIGIGSYRIDLHPSTGQRNYIDVSNWPFQIPLGSLIPQRIDNLLAAGKAIGTTHITNGCYRLHPVEWNIGEAAGTLAAYCLSKGVEPRAVRNKPTWLSDFQARLESHGVHLHWPEEMRLTPRLKLFGVVD